MKPELSEEIAEQILSGFNLHYQLFRRLTRRAHRLYINGDWSEMRRVSRQRITIYDRRVRKMLKLLREHYSFDSIDVKLWREIKYHYLGLLYQHKQPELAETFYNSVFTGLFHREYYNNENIFVRPGKATAHLDSEISTYQSYYPASEGLDTSIRRILIEHNPGLSFDDIDGDVQRISERFQQALPKGLRIYMHFQLHVLNTLFYRNKAAYIVGRVLNGPYKRAIVIPLLKNDDGKIFADTLLTQSEDIANLFSFAREYFMVDMKIPSAVADFLLSILPTKTSADVYAAIGLHKHGKSEFYRDFLRHLTHSNDVMITAPGIKGLVMTVFTLPSYPYVFKVIRDVIQPPKTVTREIVREKYLLVKMHDRVGRMADTLEYSNAALPLNRFSKELLDELKRDIPSSLEFEKDQLVIKHVYIERRMVPLNMFIETATAEELKNVIIDYGNAVKELAAANIFPGDLLFKNFGVTAHGRVVFYDYDEIDYLDDCNFRYIPEPRDIQDEMAAEPWYSVGDKDIFPEEWPHFLLSNSAIREIFMKYHAELLDANYWKRIQQDVRDEKYLDIFPYAQEGRFAK